MRQFPIEVQGQTLQFDTDGRVLDSAANDVGTWTTTATNQLRVKKTAGGGTVDVDGIVWAFNTANQLTITQGGKLAFTGRTTNDGQPRFRLVNNRLVVDPDGDNNFEFELRCRFGLLPDGNLVVSINGVESTLDGYIEDSKSRFRFQFGDKDISRAPSSLVLAGQWERKTAGADNEIRLHFLLDDPALELTAKPLDLPAAVKVDPTRNHLALVYQSASNGEKRLQFMGSLEIRPGFTLVFKIDDSKDGGVRKSNIEVQTTFEWDVAHGALSLYVGKTKGPKSQVIEVGGALQVQLKNGELNWDFAYRKSTAGGQSMTTIATRLVFRAQTGNRVEIEYVQDGKTRRLDVTGKVVLEKATVQGGVQVLNDPSGRRVKVFVGVSW